MNKFPYRSLQPGGTLLFGFTLLLGTGSIALAAVVSDVRASKHNLSAAADGSATPSGTVPVRTVKATSETQVCVFCHTPHTKTGGGMSAPLWNRTFSTATYTPYLSSSMDANPVPATEPGVGSKVCLSCHDGTLAIGMVSVLNGAKDVAVAVNGTSFMGGIPEGSVGATSGYTRDLGIELGNDHPIAFTYDSTLSTADGELRTPPVTAGATSIVANRTSAVKPVYPLDSNQLQCPTCHDPHLSDTVAGNPPLKFLRGNRLQKTNPGGAYVVENDIMCLACHDKGGAAWSTSAHAGEAVANEAYTNTDPAAAERGFPTNTGVWNASCLNCHDTHAVQGSRRLLREGTDSNANPKTGGTSAIEETCFQCHSATGIITPLAEVPDIESDFNLNIRMPITNADQGTSGVANEVHDIGGVFDESATGGIVCDNTTKCGKDFVESQTVLGRMPGGVDLEKRHAECTDCHNPHRATKTLLFNEDAATAAVAGTHKHAILGAGDVAHSNLASGALRGTFGVEPTAYYSSEFGASATTFAVKRGDGGINPDTSATQAWVTREYQICFKCHSNFAYQTDAAPPASPLTPLLPLGGAGRTAVTTNGMESYSNVAMEFQAPTGPQNHKGVATTTDSGAHNNFSTNNQRSWHPVMDGTGRDAAVARGGASPNLWRAPWNGSDADGGTTHVAAVGSQTMHCGDCHGSANNIANGVVPDNNGSPGSWTEDGKPWGPHGSNNNFLLKGQWNTTTSVGSGTDMLCFRCHDATQYADANAAPNAPGILQSGFSGVNAAVPDLDPTDGITIPVNLHQRHAYYTTQGGLQGWTTWPAGSNGTYRCTMCHTGTAHGWKNKGFLVNLDDLGLELNIANGPAPGGALGGVPPNAELTLPTAVPPSTYLTNGQAVPKGTKAPGGFFSTYTNGPYYQGAYLRVTNFKAPGNWLKADCTGGCH